ncbi:MAG: hypothetical protein ACKO86_30205 [Dolichospermum sp.]
MNSITKIGNSASTQNLIDTWLEQEQNGNQFPVDFDIAWQIAGYATKASAKRKLSKLHNGIDFSTDLLKNPQRGRSSHSIQLTCDALKHFCLLAETEEGQQIRQYFIECEKKWKLVEKHRPEVADEIEILHLKLQLAQAETQKALAEKAVLDTRHLIVATCPEPVQQKILGYEVVKEIEYRDRIIQDNQVINDGSTVSKTELCKRYGFITKTGNPDYTKLKRHLDSLKLPDYAWKDVPSVRDNQELRRDYLGELDRMIMDDSRQLWCMES